MKIFILLLVFFLSFDIESKAQESSLRQSIDNQYRSPLNKKRDVFRNPKETLDFFVRILIEIDINEQIIFTRQARLTPRPVKMPHTN